MRPELVVEIAFDGIQASSRYPGGVALRFARVVRYRPDKQRRRGRHDRDRARAAGLAPARGHEQHARHRQDRARLLHARDALAEVEARERHGHDREERAEHGLMASSCSVVETE